MTGGSEPQQTSPMGRYAYDDMGFRTVNVIHGDWAPGYGYLAPFMEVFKIAGGEVVQEQHPPYPSQDYAPYLSALKEADAVAAWLSGMDAITFLNQYYEYGIYKRMPLIAAYHGQFIPPYILDKARPEAADAAIGVHTPTSYTALLDNDINKQFVKSWREKYGHSPYEENEGAYVGGLIALKALEATGGDTTPEKLYQAIMSLNFKAPEGTIHFDAKTGCAIKDIHIIKVDKQDGEFVWVPVHTYENVPPSGFGPPPGPPPGH